MALHIKEISKITLFMERASTNGLTVEHLMVTGNTIKCMESEYSLGTMVEDMKESISMIRNMVKVYSFGQMVANMMVVGPMESKKVSELIQQKRERSN
jgi:ethanolamine utilization cobalamin adenosyltransferase